MSWVFQFYDISEICGCDSINLNMLYQLNTISLDGHATFDLFIHLLLDILVAPTWSYFEY